MIILGIDPWTTTVWFAVLDKKSFKDFYLLDYWIIETTPKTDLKYKLFEIWTDYLNIIEKYNPQLIVVEKLFFTNNIKTWIDVAHARWLIIYEAIKKWIEIQEYTPLQLKKAIAWNWNATKNQLQNAIKIIFKMTKIPKPDDAADAIWLAYMWNLNYKNI